jgi:hypothetical protein
VLQQGGYKVNLFTELDNSSRQTARWRRGQHRLQFGNPPDGDGKSGACDVEIPWGRLQQQDARPRQRVTGAGNELLRLIAAHERSWLPEAIAWLTKSWLTAFASAW